MQYLYRIVAVMVFADGDLEVLSRATIYTLQQALKRMKDDIHLAKPGIKSETP